MHMMNSLERSVEIDHEEHCPSVRPLHEQCSLIVTGLPCYRWWLYTMEVGETLIG